MFLKKGMTVEFLTWRDDSDTTENSFGAEPQNSSWCFVFYVEKIKAKVVRYINSNNIQVERTLQNGKVEKYNIGKKGIQSTISFIKDRLQENNVRFDSFLNDNDLSSFDDFYVVSLIS